MTDSGHDSIDSKHIRALQEQRENFDDYNKELSGQNVKENRFLRDDDDRTAAGRSKKEREAAANRLQLLLSDPAYAAAYQSTMNAVTDAEGAVYDALVESSDKLKDTGDALENAIERGASAEDIARLQKEHDEVEERHRRMQEHEAELAAIRARMENPDKPLSPEELGEIKKRTEEIKDDAQNRVTPESEFSVTKPENTTVADLPLGSP